MHERWIIKMQTMQITAYTQKTNGGEKENESMYCKEGAQHIPVRTIVTLIKQAYKNEHASYNDCMTYALLLYFTMYLCLISSW